MKRFLCTLLAAGLAAAPVSAKPPLREVAAIDDALFDLGVADRIRRECPRISARFLRAVTFINRLERQAEDLGYTEAEIEAYIDSDAEKDRLRARAAALFAAEGVIEGQPETYCRFGLSEIDRDSRIGSFLRAQ